jgi:hypothetical protein
MPLSSLYYFDVYGYTTTSKVIKYIQKVTLYLLLSLKGHRKYPTKNFMINYLVKFDFKSFSFHTQVLQDCSSKTVEKSISKMLEYLHSSRQTRAGRGSANHSLPLWLEKSQTLTTGSQMLIAP